MCPRTPSLSPEYSHKVGLQAVLTRMPLQTRPVTQRRSRGARYNGPDHTWASEQDEAVPRGDVTAGLRLVLNEAKGVPARFVFVKPATTAKGDERRVASLPSPQHICQPATGVLKTRSGSRKPRAQIHHRPASCHGGYMLLLPPLHAHFVLSWP
jgi:hypothetical protein